MELQAGPTGVRDRGPLPDNGQRPVHGPGAAHLDGAGSRSEPDLEELPALEVDPAAVGLERLAGRVDEPAPQVVAAAVAVNPHVHAGGLALDRRAARGRDREEPPPVAEFVPEPRARRAVPPGYIDVQRDRIGFAPTAGWWLDIAEFEETLQQAGLPAGGTPQPRLSSQP